MILSNPERKEYKKLMLEFFTDMDLKDIKESYLINLDLRIFILVSLLIGLKISDEKFQKALENLDSTK